MNVEGRRVGWMRIIPIGVAAVLLWIIFRGLPIARLGETFGRMRIGWFLAAILCYGMIFVPAAWRWHLILKLAGKAVGFAQTLHTSLIGHFFYTTCFGVIGGDSAKALIYARRFGFDPPAIMATAPLDRLLGFFGSLIFTALALCLGLMTGGFANAGTFAIHWPFRTVAVAGLLLVFLLLFAARFKAVPAVERFWTSLTNNLRLLSKCGRALVSGLGCGFVVQLALTAALACNLAAVSSVAVPWEEMLWSFPFIIAISALPISVGGLGTREGAAVLLWSAYGIPKPDSIAASLLTLAVALFWAVVGGLFFVTSQNKRRAGDRRAVSKRDAGFPQNTQSSQSGKLLSITTN
jgi:glycosyltransferase 2 family protein